MSYLVALVHLKDDGISSHRVVSSSVTVYGRHVLVVMVKFEPRGFVRLRKGVELKKDYHGVLNKS